MRHLLDGGTPRPTIVIGFDARRNSRIFARDSAAVIASLGGHAIALEGPLPTPVLAFAVRRLGADAGDGWLREKFTEIGVIQYEHEADTEVEYEAFAAVTTA